MKLKKATEIIKENAIMKFPSTISSEEWEEAFSTILKAAEYFNDYEMLICSRCNKYSFDGGCKDCKIKELN